ncbi:hypothetical protein YC2023_066073 [Brassica napus]
MAVRVCPCVSVSTHISTLVLGLSMLVLGLSTLALPVDCSGNFGPCGLSVQYTGRSWVSHTHDICGCLWLSVSTHRTSMAVRVCPCVSVSTYMTSVAVHHTHRMPWVSVNTHRTSVCVRQHTHDVCDFGPRGLSVQYTQDVRWCPPAHTRRSWLSVCVRVCPSVSVSTYRTSVAVHQYTDQHVGPWTQHAGPSRGLFGMSVAVCGCPSAHTGHLWLFVCVRVCSCVSVSTHRTSVGVRQHTQDVCGCPSLYMCVCVCPSAHTRRLWLSIITHINTLVLGLSTMALPVDCLGDFGPRGLSVHYTQDVRGCPPAHIGHPWVSAITHRTSVAVSACPSAHTGRPWLSVCVFVCPCVFISTHMTSVAVHQYTYQHAGPWTQHAGPSRGLFGIQMMSVSVRVCPSAHTGRPWLSISTHISPLVLGISTLTLLVDCSGDFGPRGLSVQYTQVVRWCPPAHTGRPWLSVFVRVCPSVSVSTYRMSVAVHQYTYQHVVHTGRPWVSAVSHRKSVAVRQHTQDVCGCSSAHTGRPRLSVSTHRMYVAVRVCLCVSVSTHKKSLAVYQYTYQHVGPRTQHAGPSRGLFGMSVAVRGCPSAHRTSVPVRVCLCVSLCVRQHIQDVCGCPSVHISARCTHRTSVCVRQHTQDVRGTNRTSVGVRQHTHDIPHTGHPWLSACVRVCPSAHISARCTQDVRGYPSAYTRRPCVSVSTHRTSVAVRVCPCVSVSTHKTYVAVHQYTYQHVVHTGRPLVSASTHKTFVAVRVCPCVSVCVRQHTQDVRGSPSVHRSACWSLDSARWPFPSTVWVILAHLGCLFSTLRTSVGVRHHTQDVRGCLWLSVSTHRTSVAVRVWPCVSISTHRTSVGVCQHTKDVRGCPSLSMCVCVCPSAHTRRLWLSIITHINTLVLGLSTLALPVDCLGDFGLRGLSIQYTQDVRGCPPSHTGSLWLSVSTHRTSVGVRQHTQDVRVCPSAHTGCPWLSVCVCVCPSAHTRCPWLSISTHISTLVLGLSTLALPVDCLGDFGPRGLFVQYTHDVRGCLPAHTGRLWLFVAVRQHTQDIRACPCVSVCVLVCPSAHTGRLWLSISTHISTLVLGLRTLTLPVDCSGDFGPCGLSVQYTQDVCVCPSSHTRRLWVSISTHMTSVCVRQHIQDVLQTGRPWVSASTHMTSVAVRGCPTHRTSMAVRVCPCVSVSTHISTLVLGLSMLALPVDCSGDFGPCGLSVQYTGPHTGCMWLSVSTHRTSMAVRVCPSAHTGRMWLSISTHISTLALGLSTLALPVDCLGDFGTRGLSVQYTQDVRVCPTHKTSVGVCQHTQDVRGCPCVSVYVRLCPSAHTGCPWQSISTQISMLVLGLSTLALPVDCLGNFGPRGLSAHYTQDVCGCPPAHIGHPWVSASTHRTSVAVSACPSAHTECPWLSVCVCVCPCVSISTHMTSVAVHQYTYQHAGPWTQHAGPSRGLFGTHRMSVAVHQYTYQPVGPWTQHADPSRGLFGTSVAVRLCPSANTGRPWLSMSTHISTLVLGLSTLALPVDCLGDFGPCGLSIQYTQDVRGCPPSHTGSPWLSVSTHRTSVGVPHTRSPWLSVSTHISTLVLGLSTLALPVDCLGDFGPRGLFVHYTQDVRGCLPAHTGRLWLFVAVRQHTQDVCACPSAHIGCSSLSVCICVCPSAHTRRPLLYISTHINTLVLGLSMLALPVDCLGDFGPRGLSFHYTQDVRGCPPAHIGHPWVSASTHRTSVAVSACPSAHTGRPWLSVCVCVCPCVSISTHMTSVAVHQYTYQHAGPWTQHAGPSRGLFGIQMMYVAVRVCPSAHTGRTWLSISTHISPLVLGLSTLTLLVDCSGDFGPRGLSVQYTQVVRWCPPAHTGRPWLSVCVRVCPSVSVSTHRTSVAVYQYTYQHVGHTGRPWVSAITHKKSGAVHQHTQDVRGCPSAHTGRPRLSVSTHRMSVAVRVCLCVSVSTHKKSLAVYRTHRTSVGVCQHTQDVCGCSWLSVSTHRTSVPVRVCLSVSLCVCQHIQDVCGCPSVHITARWSLDSGR